jgi:hypothetical protein
MFHRRRRLTSSRRDKLRRTPQWRAGNDKAGPMTNIHLIGGEKGGVGKSLVARVLAQYFIDHSMAFIGLDSNRTHAALLRFYAGYASPILIDEYESLDTIVEAATQNPERRILVDLAAQSNEGLTQWMDDSQLLEVAREIGLNIRYWHVMDSGRDSVELLKRLMDRHAARLNYTLVLNQIHGADFHILDSSGEKERALAMGAVIVSLNRIDETTMTKIDAASMSFWAIVNKTESDTSGLTLLERQRVKVWLKNLYVEFAKAGV